MPRRANRPKRRSRHDRKGDAQGTQTNHAPAYQRPVRLIIADAANEYLTRTAGAGQPFAADELADHILAAFQEWPDIPKKLAFDCVRYRKEIEAFKKRIKTLATTIVIGRDDEKSTESLLRKAEEKLMRAVFENVDAVKPKMVRATSEYKKYAQEITVLLPA